MKNGNLPARPIFNSDGHTHTIGDLKENGLTKREAFAKAAMKSLLSNINIVNSLNESKFIEICKASRFIADEQLKELDK